MELEQRELLASVGIELPDNLSEEDEAPYKVLASAIEEKRIEVLGSFRKEKEDRIVRKLAEKRVNSVVIPIRVGDMENREIMGEPAMGSLNDNFFNVF